MTILKKERSKEIKIDARNRDFRSGSLSATFSTLIERKERKKKVFDVTSEKIDVDSSFSYEKRREKGRKREKTERKQPLLPS